MPDLSTHPVSVMPIAPWCPVRTSKPEQRHTANALSGFLNRLACYTCKMDHSDTAYDHTAELTSPVCPPPPHPARLPAADVQAVPA
eukprot:359155-Chlamydomonas_euryale.AAC.9